MNDSNAEIRRTEQPLRRRPCADETQASADNNDEDADETRPPLRSTFQDEYVRDIETAVPVLVFGPLMSTEHERRHAVRKLARAQNFDG